jgi:putative methyltransferase (TIGR04325 family)
VTAFASIGRRIGRRLERVAHLPVIGDVYNAVYTRHFNSASGHVRLFRGIYPDFASAVAAAPKDKPIGFDNEASSLRLADDRHHIFPSDYPILFWLKSLLGEHDTVFDYGGNVGISYFGFEKYLAYPDGLRWVVYDVPAVAEAGRRIATEENARHLSFVTDFVELDGADIFLAAGVLQFVEDPLKSLREAKRRPRHVLINTTPVHPHAPSTVTLHAFGTAFCGYHLFNRDTLLSELQALGYELVDEWKNPGKQCIIPGHPDHCIYDYSGFYLTQR